MSNKGRTPNTKELSLWDYIKKTVTPLHPDHTSEEVNNLPNSPKKLHKNSVQSVSSPPKQKESSPASGGHQDNTLDRKTLERLRKGKMAIEAVLDLHGMTQDQAHQSLNAFVMRAYHHKKRCILIITGKGTRSGGEGILKSRLPDWLSLSPLNDIVLKHVPAKQKDGGAGAFYLYLKRHR